MAETADQADKEETLVQFQEMQYSLDRHQKFNMEVTLTRKQVNLITSLLVDAINAEESAHAVRDQAHIDNE